MVGFFLDHPNFEHLRTRDPTTAPAGTAREELEGRDSSERVHEPLNCSATHTCGNYSSWMQTVVHDQNVTAARPSTG